MFGASFLRTLTIILVPDLFRSAFAIECESSDEPNGSSFSNELLDRYSEVKDNDNSFIALHPMKMYGLAARNVLPFALFHAVAYWR